MKLPMEAATYPEEVLRSAWNPDLEEVVRLHAPVRPPRERWLPPPPPAWADGVLEDLGAF
jgi:hypothetical protein